MAARRANSLLSLVLAAALAALALHCCQISFVGGAAQATRGVGLVARPVGVDYLLRNGPRDADPPLIDPKAAAGPAHEVTFKKRPFGIARYAPGKDGTGAVVMEVTPQSRYPGDPQGQAFVAGVQPAWVVKTVNGDDVTGVRFEDIMESLDDEVLDPVAALSLNLKESGTPTDFTDKSRQADKSYGAVGEATFKFGGGQKAELPITIQYVEQR
mmetsp:Transcript_6545/g.7161  ORF Transcript_6545/g.7161 Transcript_6545/m.7161 type:complete len:213 (+) Transcript_6545:84-722(+)